MVEEHGVQANLQQVQDKQVSKENQAAQVAGVQTLMLKLLLLVVVQLNQINQAIQEITDLDFQAAEVIHHLSAVLAAVPVVLVNLDPKMLLAVPVKHTQFQVNL